MKTQTNQTVVNAAAKPDRRLEVDSGDFCEWVGRPEKEKKNRDCSPLGRRRGYPSIVKFMFSKSLKMLNKISLLIQNSFKNLIFKNLNFFNVNRRLNTSPHHSLIAVLYKIKSTVGLGP